MTNFEVILVCGLMIIGTFLIFSGVLSIVYNRKNKIEGKLIIDLTSTDHERYIFQINDDVEKLKSKDYVVFEIELK